MSQSILANETNRSQLQQIISGLSEGVILAEVDQTILWANEAALSMHGLSKLSELGANGGEYAERFALRYRNNHPLTPEQYPINRAANGETFSDVLVEVRPASESEYLWVHRLRSLVITDSKGQAELLVLILSDATEWASAEQRFEKTFNANSGTGSDLQPERPALHKGQPGVPRYDGLYTRSGDGHFGVCAGRAGTGGTQGTSGAIAERRGDHSTDAGRAEAASRRNQAGDSRRPAAGHQ